jgi:hypothetical protein
MGLRCQRPPGGPEKHNRAKVSGMYKPNSVCAFTVPALCAADCNLQQDLSIAETTERFIA